ncbi:MAG: hypothetical protein R3310_11900 [Candidatus Competibacteraceae bacterium]|nr:hypothetical protein [Candidatus Competibacteraceae bacterium]
MQGLFIIRDKGSDWLWNGSDWTRRYDEARQYHQIEEAVQDARGLQGAQGPVEVVRNFDYWNQPPAWSSES